MALALLACLAEQGLAYGSEYVTTAETIAVAQ